MAYQIVNSRGDTIAVIPSGDVNTNATSLTLFGANFPQYGLGQNENFVFLIENFAKSTPPDNAVVGQLWFNISNNRLYVYTNNAEWVVLADEAYVQAQKVSPIFTGIPQTPTANSATSSSQIASTAFVQNAITARNLAPLLSPEFTGSPLAPTVTNNAASTTQIATTAFVQNVIDSRGLAPLASPSFTGVPQTPTAGINTANTQIASTEFVVNRINSIDLTPYAPKASPVLTGVPTAPTANVNTANAQIATTEFVVTRLNDINLSLYAVKNNTILTGIPVAPTASASTNTQQIATTSFVQAQKVSPEFTGVPTAPTAANATANTQIATTAFVSNLIAQVPVQGTSELAGSIKLWISPVPPQGWALCNGEAVSRTTYATLFSRIGTAFGPGNGTTTFNLPNLSARFPMGVGTIGGTDFTLGSSGGSANTPVISHTHPITNQSVAISDPGHFHVADGTNGSFNFPALLGRDGTFDAESIYSRVNDAAYQAGSRVGTARTGITASVNIGIGAPSESVVGTLTNLPPYQVFYYIIRMSDEGTGGGTIQAGTAIDIARNGGFSVINNTGVTRLIAGTGITLSSETGNITIDSSGGGGTADIAGSIKLWGGSTEPTDWMFCDGRALSRSAYPSLFAKIGTTYGAGDGTTTFNLPNITNRFAVGAGGLYPNGATGGSADAVVVSHTHSVSDPGHGHILSTITRSVFDSTGGPFGYGQDTSTGVGQNVAINSNTTGISVSAAGQSGTNANLPPYLGLRYIIKINDNGTQRSGAGGGDTSRAGDIKWVAYAQANFPPGWQLCDGTALVRASYPALFARIGTTYGPGNGTTTFNVPDLRGRFIVSEISGATGASRASVNRGNVGGSPDAVVVSHSHGLNDPGHSHLTKEGTFLQNSGQGFATGTDISNPRSLRSTANVTGISIDSAGVSGSNANMPPYVTMVAIIKLDDDSVNTGGILQAGPGISLTTSGAYTTITNTAQGGLAPIAGRGITTTATPAGTIINASVAGIVAGNNITVSVNNEGIVTINSTASGGGGGGTGGRIVAFGSLTRVTGITSGNALVPGSGLNIATATYNGYFSFAVTFETPIPDNSYKLLYSVKNQTSSQQLVGFVTTSTTGFTLTVNTGISRTDQPLPTLDFIVVSGTGGGGGGGVSSITAQAPLNASTSGGAVTLSLSGSVITTGNQTFNGEKTFVNPIRGAGGIICNSYNFSDTSSSMFWTGSEINLNVAGLMRFFVRSDKAGFSYSTVEKVGGGSFASYSDQRYKQDIVVYDKGLNELKTLTPQKFRYTREFMRAKKPSKEFVGLIAQMVETGPFASCVSTDENGYKTVDVSELTFALINAVKELSDRLEKLESK